MKPPLRGVPPSPARRGAARRRGALLALSLIAAGPGAVSAQRACDRPVDPYDSGGPLASDEAAYDVRFYDLAVEVFPADSTIRGRVTIHATVTAPTAAPAFDLDTLLAIESVRSEGEARSFLRCGGRVFVDAGRTLQPGEALRLEVRYGGRPRVAPRPPWDGGFTWARTDAGAPWIATSNQTIGGDVWWPQKDHVSDKPDSVRIAVTVPDGLVAAANGREEGMRREADGRVTWRWFVSTPISAYNVALNIAPYRTIRDTIASVAGDSIPVVFFVLPEDYEKGLVLFDEILEHLRWFERRLGPYPFRADKYGVAQTPHLGMEHQTIIAYGADFDNRSMTGGVDWGFDALHHHELSHEWWGNLVTNADWKDMWLHEGFGSYMQFLWLEDTQGVEKARAYAASWGSDQPVAARGPTSSQTIYNTGFDIYAKGARVLHTLRGLMGDDAFFRALRRMAYPDPQAARTRDGSAVRFAETRDFRTIAEEESGMDLGWFFDVYVYQGALPRLTTRVEGDRLHLEWVSPTGGVFSLPVPVEVDGRMVRVPMDDGTGTLTLPPGGGVWVVDPEGWLLRER